MAKDKTIWVAGLVIIGILFILPSLNIGGFAITGNEDVERSVPSIVSPGQTFTVSYTATSTSGTWGASLEDSVSGGCTFPSGSNSYKDVLLSDSGNTRTIEVTAPQSGSCTFSGDFKFGTDSIGQMTNSVITISSSGGGDEDECSAGQTKCESTTYYTCSSGDWESQGEVIGQCGYGDGSGDGDNGNGDYEPPTFDLDMILFSLGEFAVTLKLLLILVGGLFIFKIVFSK